MGSWELLEESSEVAAVHGRVWVAGTDSETRMEAYTPDYLLRGVRPAITDAPASVAYGQSFSVPMLAPADISSACFIGLSAVTHAFNMGQRNVALDCTQGDAQSVDITAPNDPNLAPPGHYMLFVLDASGCRQSRPLSNLSMRDASREELAARLRQHRGDYGFDAPLQGLAPWELADCCSPHWLASTANGAAEVWRLQSSVASAILLASFSIYLHATRRGKFDVWAEVLCDLELRGDEHLLDMGCGRGAVMSMLARLVPHGKVVGLDLWTSDQSGNHADATQRNLVAEGVSEWSELQTGDMLAMPFPDGTFDLVVSSMAIHNVDERNIRNHRRRLRAVDEAVRVIKPGVAWSSRISGVRYTRRICASRACQALNSDLWAGASGICQVWGLDS